MIGYVTLGTNDPKRAAQFYDALFAVVGVKKLWNFGDSSAWAKSREDVALLVQPPFDGDAASVGNGAMVALRMENRAQVDAFHAKAIALGATDEGAPGPRGSHGFYGGYFRDLDGNKLNAYVPA